MSEAGSFALAVPLVLSVLAASGFVVNEWTAGAMASTMGLGHNHMLEAVDADCGNAEPGAHAHRASRHAHMCESGTNGTRSPEADAP